MERHIGRKTLLVPLRALTKVFHYFGGEISVDIDSNKEFVDFLHEQAPLNAISVIRYPAYIACRMSETVAIAYGFQWIEMTNLEWRSTMLWI